METLLLNKFRSKISTKRIRTYHDDREIFYATEVEEMLRAATDQLKLKEERITFELLEKYGFEREQHRYIADGVMAITVMKSANRKLIIAPMSMFSFLAYIEEPNNQGILSPINNMYEVMNIYNLCSGKELVIKK